MRMKGLCFLAAGMMLLALPALAKPVTNWQNRANYPARLKAVIWGKTRLDTNTPVTFDGWTIHFNKREPVVTYEAFGPHQNVRIGQNDPRQVDRCTNPAVGTRRCQFDIWLKRILVPQHQVNIVETATVAASLRQCRL